MNNFWYEFLKKILLTIYKIYYNPKIIGKEKLNIEGPIIIIGNHKNKMDKYNLMISTKKRLTFMVKEEYLDFYKSSPMALEELYNGGVIVILIEDIIDKTNKALLSQKIASMAIKTKATIITCNIKGDYKFRSKNLNTKYKELIKVTKLSTNEVKEKIINIIDKYFE